MLQTQRTRLEDSLASFVAQRSNGVVAVVLWKRALLRFCCRTADPKFAIIQSANRIACWIIGCCDWLEDSRTQNRRVFDYSLTLCLLLLL